MTSKQKGNGSTGPGAISSQAFNDAQYRRSRSQPASNYSQAFFGKAGKTHMKLTKLSLTFLTFTAEVCA
jgi:hypothetical protein